MTQPLRVTKEYHLTEEAVKQALGLTRKQMILSIARPPFSKRPEDVLAGLGFIVTVKDMGGES